MGKFNWWRRHKKRELLKRKDAFKGQSFLLQQILHGDFDHSDFLRQAREELVFAEQEKAKVISKWVASPEALSYKLDEVDRKYIKRHNKLMEDYDREEFTMLFGLRASLLKEFEIDCWDEALNLTEEGTILDLYKNYDKLARKKIKEIKDGQSECRVESETTVGSTPNS